MRLLFFLKFPNVLCGRGSWVPVRPEINKTGIKEAGEIPHHVLYTIYSISCAVYHIVAPGYCNSSSTKGATSQAYHSQASSASNSHSSNSNSERPTPTLDPRRRRLKKKCYDTLKGFWRDSCVIATVFWLGDWHRFIKLLNQQRAKLNNMVLKYQGDEGSSRTFNRDVWIWPRRSFCFSPCFD